MPRLLTISKPVRRLARVSGLEIKIVKFPPRRYATMATSCRILQEALIKAAAVFSTNLPKCTSVEARKFALTSRERVQLFSVVSQRRH